MEMLFSKWEGVRHSTGQEDRDFFWILLVSFVFYSFLCFYMVSLPLVEMEVPLFESTSPRTAQFIVQPPSIPEQVSSTPEPEMLVPEKKKVDPILLDMQPKPLSPPPSIEKKALDVHKIRKKNQETARKSGLLKLLGRRKAAKTETMGEPFSPFETLTSFDTLRSLDEGILMNEKEKEEEEPYKIKDLQPEIKRIFLGGKMIMAVENPFEIRGNPLGLQYRSMESILKVVQSYQSGITFLYNKVLQKNPDIKGHITLEFTLLADGRLDHVHIVSSRLYHSEFEAALLDHIRAWRFESIPEGEVTIVYPIGFSPAS